MEAERPSGNVGRRRVLGSPGPSRPALSCSPCSSAHRQIRVPGCHTRVFPRGDAVVPGSLGPEPRRDRSPQNSPAGLHRGLADVLRSWTFSTAPPTPARCWQRAVSFALPGLSRGRSGAGGRRLRARRSLSRSEARGNGPCPHTSPLQSALPLPGTV